MKQSNSENHDAAASSHSEDDWIMAYENFVSQSGSEPEEFPENLSGEDQQQLVEVRQTIDALHAVYGQDADALKFSTREPPPTQLGDFRILHEIGRGGMGVVYEAEQISLARRVALKVLPFAAVLDPKHLQRFKNEARAAANLEHPNIVHVHSVGCERGVHYYAMQYIEGQSLAEVIDQLRQPSGSGTTADNAKDRPAPSREAEPKSLAAFSSAHSTESQNFFRAAARLGIQAAEALEYAPMRWVLSIETSSHRTC